MSHFYGILQAGSLKDRTIRGHKSTGICSQVASYAGGIQVDLVYNPKTGKDEVIVKQTPWQNKGKFKVLYKGILGE